MSLRVWKKKISKITLARNILEKDPKCNKKLVSELFKTSRSLLYYKSRIDKKDELIKEEFKLIHEDNLYYGHRRLAWSMNFSFKKAIRLMKKFDIKAKVRLCKKFIKPGDIWLPEISIPNLVKELAVLMPNQVWRTDFTFLKYRWIVFYLATVIDDYTKEIVWYSIGLRHTKEFTLLALKDAIRKTLKIPHIFHSDQWSEYRSFLMLNFLSENNILVSMSKKWSPWENWWQESYYWKFKLEMWYLNRFESFEEAIEAIHHQIYYYNNKRIHTSLKMNPAEFRKQHVFKNEIEKYNKDCYVYDVETKILEPIVI